MNPNSLINAASFTPKSLQFPDSWVGHLPFAAWLIQEISPTIFVELGLLTGNSYFSFCQSVVESIGAIEDISNENHTHIKHTEEQQESFDPNLNPSRTIEYESHGAYIESPAVLALSGEQVINLVRGKIYRYTYTVRFTKNASNMHFGMLIKTTSGVELGGGVSASGTKDSLVYVEAGSNYRAEFRFCCALNPGVYFLNAGVIVDMDGSETYLHRMIDIAMFMVQPDTENLATSIVDFGCYPELELQLEQG